MLSECLDEEYFLFLDWNKLEEFNGHCGEIEEMAESFVMQVISIFRCCDIKLEEYLIKQNYSSLIDYKMLAEDSILFGYGIRYSDSTLNRVCKKSEFSMNRKKEAITAILEVLGVKLNGAGAIPMTQIQKFVYFLTGTGRIDDDIRNTYIADLFKPSKDNRNDDTINNDLDFVATRFDEIGLFDLAQKVRNGKVK